MNRTVVCLTFLFLTSPAALAEKPAGVPDGATPIGNASEAARTSRNESNSGHRLSGFDHSAREKQSLSSEAVPRTSSAPGNTMKTLAAPAIKARPVVAGPES